MCKKGGKKLVGRRLGEGEESRRRKADRGGEGNSEGRKRERKEKRN